MNQMVEQPTLQQAQEQLNQTLHKGEESVCPCCLQTLKPEKRSITPKQGATIFLLYRVFPAGVIVDVDEFVEQFTKDFAKTLSKGRGCEPLKHWGLLQKVEVNERIRLAHEAAFPECKRRNPNIFQLTETGVNFVFNNLGLPKKAVILNDQVVAWPEDKFVTSAELLKKRLEELMATEVPAGGRIL